MKRLLAAITLLSSVAGFAYPAYCVTGIVDVLTLGELTDVKRIARFDALVWSQHHKITADYWVVSPDTPMVEADSRDKRETVQLPIYRGIRPNGKRLFFVGGGPNGMPGPTTVPLMNLLSA